VLVCGMCCVCCVAGCGNGSNFGLVKIFRWAIFSHSISILAVVVSLQSSVAFSVLNTN